MAKKARARKLTYKQAMAFPKAESLRARVKRPIILTLGDVAKAINGLPASKAIYSQLSQSTAKPKKLSNVKLLTSEFEAFEEMSDNTPAYVVLNRKSEQFSAWPIIWAGEQNSKFLLVGYHDPIRFGFPSESERGITIGPDKPWSVQDRSLGIVIGYDDSRQRRGGYKVIMEPMGERLTNRQLTKRFDSNWRDILGDRLQLFDQRGSSKTYRALEPLPSPEEFQSMLQKKYTKTLEKWVTEAYDIIEELGDELRDAFDNTPESLQESDAGMAREEGATALEDIASEKPEVPKSFKRLKIFVPPPKRRNSRRDRANEAAAILEQVTEAISDHPKLAGDMEAEQFTEHIEEAVSNLDDVEFPGMFG